MMQIDPSMGRPYTSRVPAVAARILFFQAAITLLMAAGWSAGGTGAALAALAGGACVLLPGVVFAARAGSSGPGSSPEDMLKALYSGAALRLLLAAGLLFMLVPVFADDLAPLLTTLAATLAVQWFALLWGTETHDGERR